MFGELSNFVDEVLRPAIFGRMDEVFRGTPLQFTRIRRGWQCPQNIDGTEPRHKRPDKCVCTSSAPFVVMENGGGGNKEVISLWAELNRVGDRIEAIKLIAGILGLALPDGDPKAIERHLQEAEEKEASAARQREALFGESGKQALSYMLERGWTEEEVRKAGIGYISPSEALKLEKIFGSVPSGVGGDFCLSIPLRSRGKLYGFKVRFCTQEAAARHKGTDKYREIGKGAKLWNLPLEALKDKPTAERWVVLVEGELDALHAGIKGLPYPIVAVGGTGNMKGGKFLYTLREFGALGVIIIPDKDDNKTGENAVKDIIPKVEGAGLRCIVAPLPGGAHDIDEYYKAGGSHEDLVENLKVGSGAVWGSAYLFAMLHNELAEQDPGQPFNHKQQTEFQAKVIQIYNNTRDGAEKNFLLSLYEEVMANYGLTITSKAIQAIADEEREANAALKRKRKLEKVTEDMSKALSEGKTKEALSFMEAALVDLQRIEGEKEFSYLLNEDLEETLWKSYKTHPKTLITNYTLDLEFKNGEWRGNENPEGYRVEFPAGEVSVLVAHTGHGKTQLLENIALDAAQNGEPGSAIYLSYEQRRESIVAGLLNIYAGVEFVRGKNRRAILEILEKGDVEKKYQTKDYGANKSQFFSALNNFKQLLKTRKLIVEKPESGQIGTLISLLTYLGEHTEIKAIFIDYVQELYWDEDTDTRTNELKQIMIKLADIAQLYNIPIIVAAQFNRDKALSPVTMSNQDIADSGWIEKKASEIIEIWSNKEGVKGNNPEKLQSATKALWERCDPPNNYCGTLNGKRASGRLYLKLTKSRLTSAGIDGFLRINPNTGKIECPCINEEKTETKKKTEGKIFHTIGDYRKKIEDDGLPF